MGLYGRWSDRLFLCPFNIFTSYTHTLSLGRRKKIYFFFYTHNGHTNTNTQTHIRQSVDVFYLLLSSVNCPIVVSIRTKYVVRHTAKYCQYIPYVSSSVLTRVHYIINTRTKKKRTFSLSCLCNYRFLYLSFFLSFSRSLFHLCSFSPSHSLSILLFSVLVLFSLYVCIYIFSFLFRIFFVVVVVLFTNWATLLRLWSQIDENPWKSREGLSNPNSHKTNVVHLLYTLHINTAQIETEPFSLYAETTCNCIRNSMQFLDSVARLDFVPFAVIKMYYYYYAKHFQYYQLNCCLRIDFLGYFVHFCCI